MGKALNTGDAHFEGARFTTDAGNVISMVVAVNYAVMDDKGVEVSRIREEKDVWPALSSTEKDHVQRIYDGITSSLKDEYGS